MKKGCPRGYSLSNSDGKTCVDKDQCPVGTKLDSNGKDCVKSSKKPKKSGCPEGQKLDSDGKSCLPANECPQGQMLGPDGKTCISNDGCPAGTYLT